MTRNNNRNNKSGKSSSTSSSSSNSNSNSTPASTSPTMKKSSIAMERLMTKSKKQKKNNRQHLVKTVIGIVAFFLASGAISFLSSTTTSMQNLASVLPQTSMRVMEASSMASSGGRPFVVSNSSPDLSGTSFSVHSNQGNQIPTVSNNGRIFVQARSSEPSVSSSTGSGSASSSSSGSAQKASARGDTIDTVIRLDSDSNFIVTPNPMSNYNYYYYDASSQAFHLHDQYTTFPDKPITSSTSNFQRELALSGKYQPTLCDDGSTYGFSDLVTLRNAIHELGDAYSQAVSRWEHYNSALTEYEMIKFLHHQKDLQKQQQAQKQQQQYETEEVHIESPPPLPEHLVALLEIEPDAFVICPHTTLRAPLGRQHKPININAEDVVIECDSCVIDTPGTHFSFGPHARNVLVRGVTMMGATETSIVFRYDGADAAFEDCYWVNNDSVGMHGAVADMNSTSTLKFYHCSISDVKHKSPRAVMHGVSSNAASSLTLRS
jgi:hypothetical protein